MILRYTLALSLIAAFATSASAATTPHARASHSAHAVAAHGHSHGRAAPATGADNSADSLNAQSLSRAQGATQ